MTQVAESAEAACRSEGRLGRASRIKAVAVPLLVYGVSRVIGAVFLTIGASRQAELVTSRRHFVLETVPSSPGYWGVLANWDGQWYKTIALQGFPVDLPTNGGQIAVNPWAFYPLFPTLARFAMRVTGLPFEVAAGLLSLCAGALAVVLLYLMLRERMSAFASTAAVAALCAFPTAPVLQVAYSESVSLLVLVLAIWALRTRRYGVFVGLAVVLSLARPIAPPLMLAALAHWVARWRREGLPGGAVDWVKPVLTVAMPGASTFLWPVIAWVSTGERRAFFASQEAWRQDAHTSFLSASVLGQSLESPLLMSVAALILFVFLFLALRRPAGRWGPELRAWVVAYPAYIMLATQPTMSLFRYLMFALVPWWPLPEAGERADESGVGRVLRWLLLALLVGGGFLLQYLWVTRIFTVHVSPAMQPFP